MALDTGFDSSRPRGSSATGRLLVITFHYPPDGSIGGYRWNGLGKELVRLGWKVHVLTAASQPEPRGADGPSVHVSPRARTLNDAYNSLAERVRALSTPVSSDAPGQESPVGRGAGPIARLRREVSAALSFPDHARGWILRTALRARRLIDAHGIDMVVTSGPPHSAHLAGLLATAGKAVPLVVDMRDPWAGLMAKDWGRSFYESRLNRTQIPALERRIIHAADRVIVNTPEFARVLAGSYPHASIAMVPNGVDPERLPSAPAELFAALSIAYVGTVYAGRDLSPVLRAMKLFFDRNPRAREDGSRLRVAGPMDDVHAARFNGEVAALELGAEVEKLGVLPSGDALRLLSRSRLSVVLAQNQELQIPAKLYESVGMHVPTLVIAEPDSAAAREGERLGAFTRQPGDIPGICDLFEQLWSGGIPQRVPPRRPIEYAHLATEMSDLLAAHLRRGRAARPVEATVP
jgi:glycosyltransferase involved in cell wall biosynthesis